MKSGCDPPIEDTNGDKLTKKEETILWRKARTAELYMKGHTILDIAQKLGVGHSIVHKYIAEIRDNARIKLSNVIESELPLQWMKARQSLQFIQQQSLELYDKAHNDSAKLQALSIFQNAQEKEFELVANSQIIDSALRFIESNSKKVNNNDIQNSSQ